MADVLDALRADAQTARDQAAQHRATAAQLRHDADAAEQAAVLLEDHAQGIDIDLQAVQAARAARGIVDEPARGDVDGADVHVDGGPAQ
jgi:hypothetical protein